MSENLSGIESRYENSLPSSGRKFYQLPYTGEMKDNDDTSCENETETTSKNIPNVASKKELLSYINRNVIGRDKTFSGAFGLRPVVYCDYVASGKSLQFIEDYIRKEVLPDYGNTHTTTTVTSLQTTLFRHEARDIVRNATHASEHDAVIFTGAGTTAAVHKLTKGLNFPENKLPVVFIGPFEHHSAFLPWHDVGATVIRINADENGVLDVDHLQFELEKWRPTSRQMIGMFSAASNITGILSDVNRITILLHKYKALAFWDYATAGPYVKIDMNPVIASADQKYVYKDAIFLSPHKFVGGVGTPGLLIAKKALFRNETPDGCGGGSVFFVRRSGHRYLHEVEMREEGGTPAIVESIRAGLCFQLKQAVGTDAIMQKERSYCQLALDTWKNCQNLVILGNTSTERLPIFSFLIRHPNSGLFLHHNFVCSLLNDMFGIQTRGGCACAGPYAMDLLGIDEATSIRIENLLVEDSRLDRTHLRRYTEYSSQEILRPGFSRLNFPYFMSPEDVDFIIQAVGIIAEQGWKMLPQYIFNPETGEWRHWRHQVFKDRKWLGFIDYSSGEMKYQDPKFEPKGPLPKDRADTLDRARRMFAQIHKFRIDLSDQRLMFDGEADELRWFLLPSEAWDCLRGKPCVERTLAFSPGSDIKRVDYKCPSYEKPPVEVQQESGDDDEKLNASGKEDYVPFSKGMQEILNLGFVDKGNVLHGSSAKDINLSVQSVFEPCSEAGSMKPEAESPLTTGVASDIVKPHSDPVELNKDKRSVEHSQIFEASPQTISEGPKAQPVTNRAADSLPSSNIPVTCSKKEPKISATETEMKWESPPKKIFSDTIEALEEYSMINDKDRVLVCLSGGKDSLSLLHTLHQYQFYASKKGINFSLGAITVDPKTASYDPSPLKGYLKALQCPYFYEEQAILEQAQNLPYECASICSFCSRMKRGRLYAAARRENYNVLAMGQHLDDLSESLLMNSFHNGVLRTMKANYTVKEGDLRVIRPFVYVREKDLRRFAEERKLPVIAENCPACFEAPKERHRMKQLLANQELLFPRLFPSLRSAMQPLMAVSRPGVSVKQAMDAYLKEDDDDEV